MTDTPRTGDLDVADATVLSSIWGTTGSTLDVVAAAAAVAPTATAIDGASGR